MKPHLQMFQADVPLMPVITTEIKMLLETLMRRFVKGREMEATNTSLKIGKINT